MEPIGWVRTRSGLLRPVYPVQGGGDWPLQGDGHRFEAGVDTVASTGFLMTGGAANTKGAYIQLIAATAFDAEGLVLHLTRQAATARWAVDFAVGGAGSEQVIFPNLIVQSLLNDTISRSVYVPIPIPAGTRISSRCQSSGGASQQMRAGVTLVGTGFVPSRVLARVTDYGFTAATTSGVQIDPGATPHTKGAYSEIAAATTNPMRALIIALGYQLKVNPGTVGVPWLMDVAVGAAGSEVVVISNLLVSLNAQMDEFAQGVLGPFPVNIPAGTRIAARAQCATGNAAERDYETVFYGVD